MGADGSLVKQAVAVGVGPSRSLRILNGGPHAAESGTIRVRSGGCTTDCGPDDVYRIRVYETTCAVPRFNNAGTQTTVLILQNPGSEAISGTVYFWNAAGTLAGSTAITIAARSTQVLNTSTVSGVAGQSGAHHGRARRAVRGPDGEDGGARGGDRLQLRFANDVEAVELHRRCTSRTGAPCQLAPRPLVADTVIVLARQ